MPSGWRKIRPRGQNRLRCGSGSTVIVRTWRTIGTYSTAPVRILGTQPRSARTARGEDLLGEGGITFHSLRHSFGTAMAAQGVPMRTLQELMGHRDFATTLIYADYAPSAHETEWAEAAFARAGAQTERNSEELSAPEST
jgi:integrase